MRVGVTKYFLSPRLAKNSLAANDIVSNREAVEVVEHWLGAGETSWTSTFMPGFVGDPVGDPSRAVESQKYTKFWKKTAWNTYLRFHSLTVMQKN